MQGAKKQREPGSRRSAGALLLVRLSGAIAEFGDFDCAATGARSSTWHMPQSVRCPLSDGCIPTQTRPGAAESQSSENLESVDFYRRVLRSHAEATPNWGMSRKRTAKRRGLEDTLRDLRGFDCGPGRGSREVFETPKERPRACGIASRLVDRRGRGRARGKARGEEVPTRSTVSWAPQGSAALRTGQTARAPREREQSLNHGVRSGRIRRAGEQRSRQGRERQRPVVLGERVSARPSTVDLPLPTIRVLPASMLVQAWWLVCAG